MITHDGVPVEMRIIEEVYDGTTKYHAFVRNTDSGQIVVKWRGGGGMKMSVLMCRREAAEQYLREFENDLADTQYRFASTVNEQ